MNVFRRSVLTAALTIFAANAPSFVWGAPCAPRQTLGPSNDAGGSGGPSSWSDQDAAKNGPITAITVWSGQYVDAVQVKYGDVWGYKHGGAGGDQHNLILSPGEQIIDVSGKASEYVDQLCFSTPTKGAMCYGGSGGDQFEFNYSGFPLSYISGHSGTEMDHITFQFEQPSNVDQSTIQYNNNALVAEILSAPDESFNQNVYNRTDTPQTQTVQVSKSNGYSRTLTWHSDSQNQWMVGLELSGEVGEKDVAKASATLKFEYTRTESEGTGGSTTKDDETSRSVAVPVTVPPQSGMNVTTLWKNVPLNIAVSYDRVFYVDADRTQELCRIKETSNVTGTISTSISTYFQQVPLKPSN